MDAHDVYFGMIVFNDGNVAYSEKSGDYDLAFESYVALMNHLPKETLISCKARGVVTECQARDWLTVIADTTVND